MTAFIVKEAERKDVGRGVIRLHPDDMKKLEIMAGDVFKIQGKKTTIAKALPALVQSRELGAVQIDGIIRENAGVSLDESVDIEKTECVAAQKITLSPLGKTSLSSKDGEAVRHILESLPVSIGDKIRFTPFGNHYQEFLIEGMVPADHCLITSATKVVLAIEEPHTGRKKAGRGATYEDIGGLKKEIERIREMIELPLKHPELFERVGVDAPKGVLLYGPPGCGKTLIARAVAHEVNVNFFSIAGSEIFDKLVGESAHHLRDLFAEARKNAPAIIFIDEIDSLAPKRESLDVGGAAAEQHKNVVTQLCALMDGLGERGQVIVMGATNIPDILDPALRRPGRFDREIEIGVPDRDGRLEILEIHTRAMPLYEDVDLEKIAAQTHGFVGTDISALSREAAMSALRRVIPIDMVQGVISPQKLEHLFVTAGDFIQALKEVQPSALREVYLEKSEVSWEDVGGLDEIKQALQEAVEWPLIYPDLFAHMDTKPPKGVLLYGPPGCGKTLIAKAVAHESGVNFISIRGASMMSKWAGETEKYIHEIFRKARQHAPCIVFLDEIDALAPQRGKEVSGVTDRALSQLNTEIDGIESLTGVMIMGATNRLDLVDEALRRAGRFDLRFEVRPPNEVARRQIFNVHIRHKPLASDVDLDVLIEITEGYSGADIANLCMKAALNAIRAFVKSGAKDKAHCSINANHFQTALNRELSVYA